ncbi:MAG: hypothetical protein R2771_02365 [Saprospiraceae bacterium]
MGREEFVIEDFFIADVNLNGMVSTLDIVLLQKVLLGIPLVHPITNWCRYVPVPGF